MTLLADGALKVSNLSVAKQATSLPSPSRSQETERTSSGEVEGGELGTPAAVETDSISIAPNEQPQNVQATQNTEQSQSVGSPEEKTAEATREAIDQSRELEQERLEEITEELNSQLNENLSLRFGRDENSGENFFQLIEKDTGDIVRQIPPQSLIDFKERLRDFAGLLFNQEG